MDDGGVGDPMTPGQMFVVREDSMRWPTYSVLVMKEAGDYLDLVCSGLGKEEVEAYVSRKVLRHHRDVLAVIAILRDVDPPPEPSVVVASPAGIEIHPFESGQLSLGLTAPG